MDWNNEYGKLAIEKMCTRASCRSFSDKEIAKDTEDALLKTALCAASGGNLQPVSIIVIKNKDSAEKLCKLCGDQQFIAQAPLNLLFILDWYKMRIYAKNQKAPYTCQKSFMHFLIGLEDVMCAAQSVETAAHLMGLGSCYVGTTNFVGDEISAEYNLPQHTFPVLLLSVGHPKTEPVVRKKLPADIVLFEERYPDLTDEFIIQKYTEKYADASMPIPSKEPYRSEMLDILKISLLTSFNESETEALLEKARKDNKINETQRRFGLHYHAAQMLDLGKDIIKMMENQGLTPFHRE